jgi:hypothetical protein
MLNSPRNREELVERFKKSWEDLEPSLFAKLYSSVPKRLVEVKRRKRNIDIILM